MFGTNKYQEGYKQGRVDGVAELHSDKGITINSVPVIPKFVADFIEENDRRMLLIGYMYYENKITDSKLDNWISENTETLYRAYLDGYTIEEDTKYRVQVGGHFVRFDSEGNMSTTIRSNSITTKSKLHSLGFDLDKAVESGLVKIEEVEK